MHLKKTTKFMLYKSRLCPIIEKLVELLFCKGVEDFITYPYTPKNSIFGVDMNFWKPKNRDYVSKSQKKEKKYRFSKQRRIALVIFIYSKFDFIFV